MFSRKTISFALGSISFNYHVYYDLFIFLKKKPDNSIQKGKTQESIIKKVRSIYQNKMIIKEKIYSSFCFMTHFTLRKNFTNTYICIIF